MFCHHTVHVAFLSPDLLAAWGISFSIHNPLEGNTLCKGADGLLCSWKSIPCEPRHQVQPNAGFLRLLVLSLASTSSVFLSLNWLLRSLQGAGVLSHAAPLKGRFLSYLPSSSSADLARPCADWLLHPVTVTDFMSEGYAVTLLLLHSVFPRIRVTVAKLSRSCHDTGEVQSWPTFSFQALVKAKTCLDRSRKPNTN